VICTAVFIVEAADVEKTERTELHCWLYCGREED